MGGYASFQPPGQLDSGTRQKTLISCLFLPCVWPLASYVKSHQKMVKESMVLTGSRNCPAEFTETRLHYMWARWDKNTLESQLTPHMWLATPGNSHSWPHNQPLERSGSWVLVFCSLTTPNVLTARRRVERKGTSLEDMQTHANWYIPPL